MALKAVAKGTLKPDREKDELTYTLGTPETQDVFEAWA
jgi:outer membrane protein assembly factor BamE (lipoprotein component of BamABCDE complex)